MTLVTQTLGQLRWHNKTFWRNPISAFFVFVFPLMFLPILSGLLGPLFGDVVTAPNGHEVKASTFYTGSILVFSIITASYSNVAIGVTTLREEGVLKRIRGTPLPGWVYLLGNVVHSSLVMLLLVVIVLTVGRIFYGVDLPLPALPAFLATLMIGAAAFSALGLACSALIPNIEASMPVTNVTVLPLVFLSGVFTPLSTAPGWMAAVATIFPVKHFHEALTESLFATERTAAWSPHDMLIIAVWGIAALLFVARRFPWSPRR